METADSVTRPNARGGRPTAPTTEPRFECPLCGGEAALTGPLNRPEFVCLDCTRFEPRTDDRNP